MNLNIWLGLCLLVVGLLSCEQIIEENLEKERMVVLAPIDSLTATSTVTFLWDEMDGADNYHLQIVSPTFDSLLVLLQDTLIAGNRFVTTLSRGSYQWRIRGGNSAYFSPYLTRTLFVDSTSDLSQQTLVVSSPPQNYITNQTNINFTWLPFDLADDYRLEVASPDFNGTVLLDINLAATTISYTFDVGTYQWRIRAQNSSSNSQYTLGTLVIDTTAPLAPALVLPADNAVLLTDTANLQWTTGSGGIYDTVYVYGDSSLAIPIQMLGATNQTIKYINANNGTYYWRVRTTDSAGNTGPYSASRKFNFQ